MKSVAFTYKENNWEGLVEASTQLPKAQLLLVFADRKLLEKNIFNKELAANFNNARIIYCSTAGEIYDRKVQHSSASCVAIQLDKTAFSVQSNNIKNFENSYLLGKSTAALLDPKDLKYIMIISDGNIINGDDVLKGIQEVIDPSVIISGGLAGDGDRFQKTLVGIEENVVEGNIVLLGLYGNHIQISTGIKGGWDIFGPEREVTKAEGNVLYEIDQTNALDLYKKYLGKYADELPGSALLFPISLKVSESDLSIVRTILSVDEEKKSMTFAGNLPNGSKIRFMKSNFDRLITAASEAGVEANANISNHSPDLTLIVSCVGRKIVLSNRVEEEVEAATEGLPNTGAIIGFYSYGEIAPMKKNPHSFLHNQTLTVTTFSER